MFRAISQAYSSGRSLDHLAQELDFDAVAHGLRDAQWRPIEYGYQDFMLNTRLSADVLLRILRTKDVSDAHLSDVNTLFYRLDNSMEIVSQTFLPNPSGAPRQSVKISSTYMFDEDKLGSLKHGLASTTAPEVEIRVHTAPEQQRALWEGIGQASPHVKTLILRNNNLRFLPQVVHRAFKTTRVNKPGSQQQQHWQRRR